MKDLFTEIWESVRRNKLRTCLTGFAVSWGIFMLIVLLGAGNGLMNAFLRDSKDIATNTISVYPGRTSKPYDGLKEGRRIEMDDKDIELTAGKMFSQYVDDVVATVGTNVQVSYGKKYSSGYIEGNYPSRKNIARIEILYGRFLNDNDLKQNRKVVVLPQNMAENLLGGDGVVATGAQMGPIHLGAEGDGKKVSSEALVGKFVKIAGLAWKVIGITKSDMSRNDNLFYAPYTTVKTVYAKGKAIDDLAFTFHGLETQAANEAFEKEYRAAVNLHHRAAPDDERALWLNNRFTQNLQMNKGTRILNIALWIIGIFTLLGGIVGVSNIMLITVKERTHEFGIRKAIGASPWDITKLIMAESVCITAIFGYIGMSLGMFACELLDKTVGQASVSIMDQNVAMLVNPSVGLDVALEATLVLIIAGTIAGFFPARKAAAVRPIEALRAE